MAEQDLPGSSYRTLLQFALLGSELGEIDSAFAIARSLQDLRPDLPHAGIVQAMTKFSIGQHEEAVRELEASVQEFPDSQLGKAMLAVCLQNSKRSGWQQLLESVIEDGRDQHAVSLASALLGRRGNDVTPASNPEPTEAMSSSMNTYWV